MQGSDLEMWDYDSARFRNFSFAIVLSDKCVHIFIPDPLYPIVPHVCVFWDTAIHHQLSHRVRSD